MRLLEWASSNRCPLCQVPEIMVHALISCTFSELVCSTLGQACGPAKIDHNNIPLKGTSLSNTWGTFQGLLLWPARREGGGGGGGAKGAFARGEGVWEGWGGSKWGNLGGTCHQGQVLVHHRLPLPPLALPLTIPSPHHHPNPNPNPYSELAMPAMLIIIIIITIIIG